MDPQPETKTEEKNKNKTVTKTETKKPLIRLDPPAGTRDFGPSDMRIRNWLFDIWRDISKKFGFSEYDCPIVEYQSLYTLKRNNDDILNEMFAFTLGENALCLRPEMTPSLARLFMSNPTAEPLPVKWATIAQCWRYEDIKRGRKREHYQWNCDSIAGENIVSEIEIFMMITTFFERVGLTPQEVQLKVSNRMILQKVLDKMGVGEDLFGKACIAIDKIAKISRDDMTVMLKSEIGLTEDQVATIYELCAVTDIKLVGKFLDETDETFLEMVKIFDMAEEVGIKKWISCDLSIVRGLSYYTNVVFEGFCITGSGVSRSIVGGGRYSKLLETYGYHKPTPMIGFGFGDVVIIETLKDLGKLPILKIETKFLVIAHNSTLMGEAMKLSRQMRNLGVCVETYTGSPRIKHAYDFANKKQIDNTILIAPNEWANGEIVWKKMNEDKDSQTKQQIMKIDDFMKSLC